MRPADNAFFAYRWLENGIINGHIDDHAVDAVSVVFLGGERAPARRLAKRLRDRPDRQARAELYRQLITATPNREVLYSWVYRELERVLRLADRNPKKRGKRYGWGASYVLAAALMGYEATNDERYLAVARDTMLRMLDHRDDRHGSIDEHRGRVMKAWGSVGIKGKDAYVNVITPNARIARSMAWYAWLVERAGGIDTSHRAAADLLLEAAIDAMYEFDNELVFAEDRSYAYYWRVTDDKIDALNHQTSAGEALLYIAELSDDAQWRSRAQQLAEFTRRVMFKEDNGTVVWRFQATPDDPAGSSREPIWKSQITIRFLWHARRLRVGFNFDDLVAVAESFRTNVLRDGAHINANFAEKYKPMSDRYGGPLNVTPHLILGDFDDKLEKDVTEVVSTQPEVGGWFPHVKTGIAYAHRLKWADFTCDDI